MAPGDDLELAACIPESTIGELIASTLHLMSLPRYDATSSSKWVALVIFTQQIRFCTSRDGTRIAYATCGAGPPLIWLAHFIHHLKFDWDSPVWRPWISALAKRHTLIRYDYRGFGLSDRDGVEFTFGNWSRTLKPS